MAAIFQIRRGTSNETLTDGELYLHKGIGSIQFGSGSSNVITLLPLNAPVNGNINLIGNISASGDVRIGGNIYLGDNLANDSVNVNSPFSGSLIPSGSNIFDLGSNTYKYKNVYATSISGAIASTNGVVSGSSQITYVNISSIPAGIVSGSSQVLGGTGILSGSSQVTPLLPTGTVSGSSQITYASISSIPSGIVSGAAQVTPLLPTGVISGSSQLNNTTITNLTVTNLTTVNETASVLFSSGSNRFGDFGDDIHSFTGSVKISGSTIITGSVSATSFNGTINATNGVVSGSSQITYANISSIPVGIVSGSSQITYANISSIPAGIVSGSSQTIANLPTGTVSGSSQITYANISSIPAGIVSGSSQTIANLPTGTVSGSSQLTSSYDTRYSLSGSILTSFSTSVDYRLDEVEYTASLFGGGITAQLDKINQATASLQSKTGSYATTGSNSFNGSQQITGSLLVSQNITGSASASFVSLAVNTTTPAQKIHLKGIVGIEAGTTGGNTADQIVFGYNGSGLSQYNHKIQTGHDAQAALNKLDFLIADGAQTQKNILQLRHDRVITNGSAYITGSLIVTGSIIGTIAATNGVVSGSSQINFTQLSGISNGIVSGSSQTIANLPTGTVSGSIQVLGGSTIHSGSSGDYQFNSIGVGTAATTVAGEIRAMNDITAFYSSDIRLKENIHPIQNALEKVESISGNTYDWKVGYEEFHSHKGNDIGVIAQEIEQILPQIVTNRDNGYKAVQYEKIVPLLIEAIKELSAKVKELESK